MEPLRWVLLAAGIGFVLIIYFLGRSRRRRNHSMVDELEENLPAFTAQSLDDLDEGVGQVRVITAASDTAADNFEPGQPTTHHTEADHTEAAYTEANHSITDDTASSTSTSSENNSAQRGIIVLYILPKPDKSLAGAELNSAAQAMGLRFGEMNIFHYMDNNRSVFSLANMLEPGSFDADTIHDLKTTGLTVFMQMQRGDPLDDLTEMLQRSYQLAGLLDARLCNHKREPLTEQDAENYRTQVADFIAEETTELSSET